ncbi:MAG: hypothetical protein ABI333_14120 [bacterium]
MFGLTVLSDGCASSSSQQTGCADDDECNPGYICDNDTCVLGDRDGSVYNDTFYIPPSDALPPDGSVCAEAHFPMTETEEHFLVPANARYMHVKAWGSGGNGEGGCGVPDDSGGLGGYSEAVFEMVPGTALVVIVGEPGRAGNPEARFGFGNRGGGGLSGVFYGPDPITPTDYDKALIIAGGGGSASVPGCLPGGTGNHTDPGIAGGMPDMESGLGTDSDQILGGGAGYRGGTGGDIGYAGKGGTSFVGPEALPDRTLRLFAQPGDGVPPNTDDEDYLAPTGETEKAGQVVIRFICTLPPPL